MPLNDKIALIPGGTGGLGSSITQRLASEGCRVHVTYNSESGRRPANAFSDSVKLIRTDVTDEHQVRLLYDTIISESQNVYIVVNTVGGYLPRKPLRDVSVDEWDQMMNINFKAAFLSTREALRRMHG